MTVSSGISLSRLFSAANTYMSIRQIEFNTEVRNKFITEQAEKTWMREGMLECVRALLFLLNNIDVPEVRSLIDAYLPVDETECLEEYRELIEVKLNYEAVECDWELVPNVSIKSFEAEDDWQRAPEVWDTFNGAIKIINNRIDSSRSSKTERGATFTDRAQSLIVIYLGHSEDQELRRAEEVPLSEGLGVDALTDTYTGTSLHEVSHCPWHLDFEHAIIPVIKITSWGRSFVVDEEVVGEDMCFQMRNNSFEEVRRQAFRDNEVFALLCVLAQATLRYPELDFSQRFVSKREGASREFLRLCASKGSQIRDLE
jgi:hypothetical protein